MLERVVERVYFTLRSDQVLHTAGGGHQQEQQKEKTVHLHVPKSQETTRGSTGGTPRKRGSLAASPIA